MSARHLISCEQEALRSTGIGNKETEATNKEVKKLQTNSKKESIFGIANIKSHIADFSIKLQLI